jgi:CRISPR-associated endonuclease Cas1
VNRNFRRVIIVGSDGFATFDAIRWITDVGASLIFLDRRGKLLFASTPTAPSDVRLRRAQCRALGNGTALNISRELISQKLHGQAAIVREMLGNSVAADAILRLKAELAETTSIDAVRLVEALAAKIYWSQWADVPIRWPRKDEGRVPAHWKLFVSRISPITRSPRLATNPANACMNLIHALCEAECRIALIATGLDPEIGLLHRDAPNRSSLANDLQETLRPMVDSFVLNWMQTELFRKADFWEDKNGNCRLMSHLCAKLCETAPIWARSVAPVVEWVAQALWTSSKSRNEGEVFPTRLTQRRRSEGRGKEFAVHKTSVVKPTKICEVCGAEGVDNRYCKSCAVEVSRETMAQVALIGNAKRRTKRGRAHITRVLSNHAVANSWWSPSSLPEWLNEECYVQKILPRLRTIKVRQIAEALGVSRPYAAQIRSGGRRPHPRHWLALAKLAGVRSI